MGQQLPAQLIWQHVLQVPIFTPFFDLVVCRHLPLQSAEFDIKKEAAWAISNATSGGTAEQIRYLVDVGAIRPLCDLLSVPDVRIVTVALEGLENILKVGHQRQGRLRSNLVGQSRLRWNGASICTRPVAQVLTQRGRGREIEERERDRMCNTVVRSQ